MQDAFSKRVYRLLLLTASLPVLIFPLYWMTVTAFTPRDALFRPPYEVIPTRFSLENLNELLSATQFLGFMQNSLIVASGAVLLSVSASTLAGYGISRFKFRYKRHFMAGALWSYMFPPILLAIPLYLIFSKLELRNTYFGLILAHVSLSLPLTISIMQQYFSIVPISLEEAAWVSGASRFRALLEICLPSALPGMLSAGIFAFALSWNDFAFAFILQTDVRMYTLPVGLATFVEQSAIHWGLIMASSALISIPSFALVIFFQRYLTGGVKRR